ncbi:MAG: hypothetical protein L6R37_007596 [Teloschistes peruensis]|nr:MAG: hypothetical protein L6R37_007596 [Teloschistes peruensis]
MSDKTLTKADMLHLTVAIPLESISEGVDPSKPDRTHQNVRQDAPVPDAGLETRSCHASSRMSPETAVGIIFGTLNAFLAALAVLQAVKYTQKAEVLLRANLVQRSTCHIV